MSTGSVTIAPGPELFEEASGRGESGGSGKTEFFRSRGAELLSKSLAKSATFWMSSPSNVELPK